MERLIGVVVLAAFSGLTCCEFPEESKEVSLAYTSSSLEAQGPEADLQGIQATAERLLDAAVELDVDRMVECYTHDVVVIPPGQPVLRGRPALRTYLKSQIEEIRSLEVGPSPEEVMVFGDWAFSRGSAVVLAEMRNHEHKLRVHNRGMEIWHRDPDGIWRIARAIGNQ